MPPPHSPVFPLPPNIELTLLSFHAVPMVMAAHYSVPNFTVIVIVRLWLKLAA